MSSRRWFNNRLPQTLAIAQFLLYFDAFWLAIAVISRKTIGGQTSFVMLVLSTLLGALGVCAYLYGGWGIANEMKRGYQVAIFASFIPIIRRVIIALFAGGVLGNMGFILIGGDIISALFQYALIALLLHPQSKEHQKIWFT